MNGKMQIDIPHERIAEFCKRNHIRRLSFFGSVIKDDFGPDSDVDVLVEFIPGMGPGLIGLSRMEIELSGILGTKADLRTPGELSRYFRDEVVSSARVEYAQR
ncbi:MAG: nucleotidyltransferase domain-containing protein [Deltaproteobacteria bacterium]|nr:nucleotidyltransferase domain-containing protein [Deltaproteobacteria bacterium]